MLKWLPALNILVLTILNFQTFFYHHTSDISKVCVISVPVASLKAYFQNTVVNGLESLVFLSAICLLTSNI